METFFLILLVLVSASAVYLFVSRRELQIRFEQRVDQRLSEIEEEVRKDAISRSARTLSGKALEKMVPFLDRFGHDPHDVRWVGDPVDLVVFDGYSKSGRREVDSITFVEVKSGSSDLSRGQGRIKRAVEKKRVFWEEFRV